MIARIVLLWGVFICLACISWPLAFIWIIIWFAGGWLIRRTA